MSNGFIDLLIENANDPLDNKVNIQSRDNCGSSVSTHE